ncbi:aminotransferase class V-fold PLP-dependent enzyme [Limnoraphis robusta]|uniref:Aminotransferase class V-fold PLP-dependent enzyme n=1 Tax=Limnoraphis robusta CCNP1315 TaxID=3110306 RepID=A0ABU5TTE0_9CYAN|nr:aminotransferase class V-fold PLP-dependent enzyme [Limnoraphis robusta]MEA5517896.1 aminotransferase class V-fold PLP-dependent enzyme [Limnoraphis robusta CCNP1315]MEA5547210.1 aminotransferase class V-fold PLP-dependent enzyme [Limnoraphis robusta CCNP1324]
MKDKTLSLELQTSDYGKYWLLDADVTFLNHGSFGACPTPVLQLQTQLREQLERQPVHFFVREWESLLDEARHQLAEFVGATAEELVFVPNATTGINSVLRSLSFSPEDELLTTNHEYNACRNALNFVAERWGAKVVVANIPFPINSSDEIINSILTQITPRTKLVLIDHISSQTGLIFPLKRLIQELNTQGIESLIDGAHAPGMLPLNLQEINATYYSGNCHKWLSAPKGAAFLYVKPDKQAAIRPLTISHGANSPRTDRSRFQLEFDWMGTHDPTAYFCIPEAIKFMGSLLPGGWLELMQYNHKMVIEARKMLSDQLDIALPCPDEIIGSMATIILPDKIQLIPQLQEKLWQQFKIEVPVIPWDNQPQKLLRISAQVYNTHSDYNRLVEALISL